jgi:hypothetical protein
LKYALLSILILAIISPIIIGFLIVKLTERERPKGIGKAIYDKSTEGIIEQRVKAERLSIFSPTSEINGLSNSKNEILVCYERSKKKIKIEFWLYCSIPFLGFLYDATTGLLGLAFLGPIMCIFVLIFLQQLKRIDHEIILTRQYIKIDNFSSKVIPWRDIKKFRSIDLPVPRYRVSILVADFFDNSKYQKPMGKFNLKSHKLLYGNGVVLDQLNYYKQSPQSIVNELNLQLKRRFQR